MTVDEKQIRRELVSLLEGGNAHMGFEEVAADFPMDRINARTPATPYSAWHFLEHMRIAQRDILDFIRDPDYRSPDYPEGYRPRADAVAGEKEWHQTLDRFRKDLSDLVEMATDPKTDLFAPIPHAKNYTIFRELLVVADHNAYHLGELALLRQELNAWPEDNPYLTGEGRV